MNPGGLIRKPHMEILFTGTGSGQTSLKRFHSSFIISDGKHKVLIDAGDSVSRALLSLNVEYNSISSVLLSHFHPDHLNGLPSLIIQMKMNKRKHPLEIFVHSRLRKSLLEFLSTGYIFAERLGFELKITPFNYEQEFILFPALTCQARENSHLARYASVSEIDPNLLASCAFLFNLDGSKVFYTGDAAEKNDLFLFSDKDIRLFISEAAHIKMDWIRQAAFKLQECRFILTHINEAEEEVLRQQAAAIVTHYGAPSFASDGMSINMNELLY